MPSSAAHSLWVAKGAPEEAGPEQPQTPVRVVTQTPAVGCWSKRKAELWSRVSIGMTGRKRRPQLGAGGAFDQSQPV